MPQTALMKDMAYGAASIAMLRRDRRLFGGRNHLPEALKDRRYYPSWMERGLEIKEKIRLFGRLKKVYEQTLPIKAPINKSRL